MSATTTRRRLLKFGGALLLCGAATFALLWFFPQPLLTKESGPVKADVIVVLGGGQTERPRYAAELYRAAEAPLVICSGLGDCESNRRLLIREGVPVDAIQLENKSTNTSENARFTIETLRKLGAKRIIIVTTWYHSRRALNTFEHYAPDLTFYSRPSYYGTNRSEWTNNRTARYARMEYVKNLGYLIRYGVNPL